MTFVVILPHSMDDKGCRGHRRIPAGSLHAAAALSSSFFPIDPITFDHFFFHFHSKSRFICQNDGAILIW